MRLKLLICLQVVAYAGLAAEYLVAGTLTHGQLPLTLTWVGLAFIAYALSLWQAEKDGGISLSILWFGTILFRALLLLTLPTLSSDIYRYLWDGYIANNGVSPYAFPIDSPQLDYLAQPIRGQANHTWMASPYLPSAQWLFGLVTAWLPIRALSMQITMVLIDLLNGALIMAILGLVGLPKYRALIYLWNPLVVIEIAHGAHVDGWMICLTMLAIWLAFTTDCTNLTDVFPRFSKKPSERSNLGGKAFRERDSNDAASGAFLIPFLECCFVTTPPFQIASKDAKESAWLDGAAWAVAPVILAFATLTKILPAFLMAALFWRWRWWRLFLFGGVVAGFLLFAGTWAGWGVTGDLDGHGLFGALRIYGDQWNYNSGIFHWIEGLLGPDGWLGWELVAANQWAKRIVAVLLLVVLGVVGVKARTVNCDRSLLRLMAIPFMAYVLLTATMHPWYLLLLLSFMPFLAPGADEKLIFWLWLLPWLYLSGAIFLSYLTYLDPQNLREYEWIRQVEWLPTLGLLLMAGLAWASLPISDKTFTLSK